MNIPRATLQRIRDRLYLGDRSGALSIVRALLSRQAQKGPLAKSDPVRCDHYDCMLPASTCLSRQAATWPGKKAPMYGFCASGDCEQGSGYARRATWDPRAGWSKGHFSFYRLDSKQQHAARKRLVTENGLQRSPWNEADELVQIGVGSVNVRTRARKGT